MLIKKPADIRPSEITSKDNYLNRREFMRAGGIATGLALASPALSALVPDQRRARLVGVEKSLFSTNETPNSYEDITSYNNYWEFGSGKTDPAMYSGDFDPLPWKVTVEGHCEKTGTFDFDEFIKPFDLEERIYRLRCVERWSMVIPWVGISLADVVKHYAPTSNAKYVAFEALHDPTRMLGQRQRLLQWPYREGLTMAEAVNPLSILAVGVYGESMPATNGAPIRLVVPWKYGFKSIKGIVRIRFVERMPEASWNMAQPNEYGFYSNVNPEVDHPRWSQATERRIGANAFTPAIPTQMFNGYAEQVAHLYDGMNLRKDF
ncbi:MAG: protein-methionine-sulfoxide reductase catalytic subunit MsrP [Proteobacteria bacterium]|nr:protein-methionine-sulfoxide reductase catalytic subunit MsrP [Pseudomonadota bacterium]MDA1064775.1 protein-methionine-sulfoxide reductase catalytic subunit MsrP [Pseudomonadota bacterium]